MNRKILLLINFSGEVTNESYARYPGSYSLPECFNNLKYRIGTNSYQAATNYTYHDQGYESRILLYDSSFKIYDNRTN